MKIPKPPPKPGEVRRGLETLGEKRKALEDKAAADAASQAGGGGDQESFRIRNRDRLNPGYADARARQIDDTEGGIWSLGHRERAQKGLLEKSLAYWGDDKPVLPKNTDEPLATAPTGGTTAPTKQAPKPAAAAAQSDGGSGALADVPWRKRRVAPQAMTRAGEGGLARLLGI